MTKTTMNICGTLGSYGIAVTSLRPSGLGEPIGKTSVIQVANWQRDAESRQDATEDDIVCDSLRLLGRWQVGEVRPMALARVDHKNAGFARCLEHL